MGTKVQCESYFPGYFSMRDLNEDSNSCSWLLYYGDKSFTNGHCYNGFLPRTVADAYPGYDKDALKRTMLEHEAVFKNQLQELHRLYGKQRDLMDEIKKKELHNNRTTVETSLSSSHLGSQDTPEDAQKWHIPGFSLPNSVCARPSTSVVEDIHSPLCSIKGCSSTQASPLPSQNGGALKDVEILDSRPTKVRRKMFDLQLPADEYVHSEEGEHHQDENTSGVSSNLPKKTAPENAINLFFGNGVKNNCLGDASQPEPCLKSRNSVADLNEPIKVEETSASVYVDLLSSTPSNGEIRRHELAAEPKSQLFGKEILLNSHHGTGTGTKSNLHLQNDANGKHWFTHMLDAGHSKGNMDSVAQGLQQQKFPAPSQPIQVLFNKAHEPSIAFLTDHSKLDQSRERTVHSLDISERNREISNNSYSESILASHKPSSYPFSPSELGKSWLQSVSSLDKPSGSLSPKSITVQIHPYLSSSTTLSRSSQSSTQSHGVFGDYWSYNSASNPGMRNELHNQNGFYHGSSSGSKELHAPMTSRNYDFLNCSDGNNVASKQFNRHDSAKFYRNLNCIDLNSIKDLNLDAMPSNSSSRKALQQVPEVIDLESKPEDHLVTLPWLRANPARKNESTEARLDLNTGELSFSHPSLNLQNETGKLPDQTLIDNMKAASCSNLVEASRTEMTESSSYKKILGFPIFEKPQVSKNESSSFTSPSVSLPHPSVEVENNRSRILDINLPCDPAVPDFCQQPEAVVDVEKETDTKVASFRHQIDLNSCGTEDETSLSPAIPASTRKVVVGIDLEAPAQLDSEEDVILEEKCSEKGLEASFQLSQRKSESPQDDCIRIAAEAIVAMSLSGYYNHCHDATCNPSEASMTDPLLWFGKIVTSYGEDLEDKLDAFSKAKDSEDNVESSMEEFDYFESMTLKLVETKEEDYMPKPLVPENLKLDETGTILVPTRTRKGHARRGRQRRDFQRDILPGLTSLSRHEVTEDLQTFGGMMRATGYLWHSGLTRRNSTRNGCGRGRRRSVVSSSPPVTASPACTLLIQQLNTVEVGLEDRSLTGWGKTTRRPRRQRFPAGNPPSVPLT